jgi:hypothetical protein
MKNLIFGFMLISAGLIFSQPETACGQNAQTSRQTNPPKLIRNTKPAKNKRKKTKLRRKVDLSKVPRVISVRPAN